MKKKLTDKPTIENNVIVMMELEESEIADERIRDIKKIQFIDHCSKFPGVITVYGRDGNAVADLEGLEERLGK